MTVFFTGIGAFVVGLGLFSTLMISLTLTFLSLLNLTGEKENKIYILWMCLLGLFLWIRYRPDIVCMFIGILLSVLIGLIYSFYRWSRECKKLRKRLDNVFNNIKEWPSLVEPDLTGCSFKEQRGFLSKLSKFECETEALRAFTPEIEENRGMITLWIIFWFLYVLHAFTVTGIENLQDLCSGIYKRITEHHFSV